MFAAEHKFPGLNCLLPVPGCQGFAQLKLHSPFPRILLLLQRSKPRCSGHPLAAFCQPVLRSAASCEACLEPRSPLRLSGMISRQVLLCAFPAHPQQGQRYVSSSPSVTIQCTVTPCPGNPCLGNPGLAAGQSRLPPGAMGSKRFVA